MGKVRGKQQAVIVAGSQLVAQGATFGRNVVFARLLSPDDLGVAAMLSLVLTLMEMATDCVAEEVLITDDGDLDSLQAAVHGLRMIRSLGLTLVAALISLPLLLVKDDKTFTALTPGAVIICLGLLAIRSLCNADVERQVRQGRYRTYALLQALPQIAALAAAIPLARWLGGPEAILLGAMVQSLVYVGLSHLFSERRYTLRLDPSSVRKVLGFGWPVLFNGVLLFGLMHGDRVVVGPAMGARALGVYTVATGLTLVPTLVLARVNSALVLPRLSRARSASASEFHKRVADVLGLSGLAATGMAFGWTCVGAELVTCVYGQKYLDAGTLVPILGLLQAMFVVRDLHGVIAMSSGDSRHPVVGNILRIVGLAFVIPVAWMGWGMVGAAWVALTWELIAYVYSALCLRQKHDVHLLTLLRPMAWIPGGSAAGAALHHACILQGISPWAVLLVGMLAIAGWWTLRNARTDRALANIATTG